MKIFQRPWLSIKKCLIEAADFFALFQSSKRMLYYERFLLGKSDLISALLLKKHKNESLRDHPNIDKDKVLNIMNLESKAFLPLKLFKLKTGL